MAVTSLTLTNPGAETASYAGWTNLTGAGGLTTPTVDGAISPHSGSRFFLGTPSPASYWFVYTDAAIPGGLTASVDAGTCATLATAWFQVANAGGGNISVGRLILEFWDSGFATLLKQYKGKKYSPIGGWVQIKESFYIPPTTRTIRLIWETTPQISPGSAEWNGGSALGSKVYWDDFTVDVSTAPLTDWPNDARMLQMGAYALGSQPADEARANSLAVMAVGQAEVVSGEHDVITHQLGAYALVRRGADRKELRAWTFKQDDHEFYVLQLNYDDTLVYDKLSQQWSDWVSPELDHWRGADGCNWAGIAVCGDSLTGKLWKIDPEGRLDYGTTPITSVIVGGMTERMRINAPIYTAEVAVSEDQPAVLPEDDVDGIIGITLRVGNGKGNWYSHGQGVGTDDNVTVRWYGLGLAQSPGIVFELTDTGYARRIDGLNIETKDDPPNG